MARPTVSVASNTVQRMERVDYVNTFIAAAPDCEGPARTPSARAGKPTIASATWAMIHDHPYRYTSGDVIFDVWADREGVPESERVSARGEFYAKPRPCLRASDLGKRFGWGIHADAQGRLALYAVGTPDYQGLSEGRAPDGSAVTVVRAMRAGR